MCCRVVGHRDCSKISIDQLTSRFDAYLWIQPIEGELLGVFDEVKQVRVRPTEAVHAIDTEGVVQKTQLRQWNPTFCDSIFNSAAYSSPMASQKFPEGLSDR